MVHRRELVNPPFILQELNHSLYLFITTGWEKTIWIFNAKLNDCIILWRSTLFLILCFRQLKSGLFNISQFMQMRVLNYNRDCSRKKYPFINQYFSKTLMAFAIKSKNNAISKMVRQNFVSYLTPEKQWIEMKIPNFFHNFFLNFFHKFSTIFAQFFYTIFKLIFPRFFLLQFVQSERCDYI